MVQNQSFCDGSCYLQRCVTQTAQCPFNSTLSRFTSLAVQTRTAGSSLFHKQSTKQFVRLKYFNQAIRSFVDLFYLSVCFCSIRDGNYPVSGDMVAVHYTGYLAATGVAFDASRPSSPFQFTLGRNQVCLRFALPFAPSHVLALFAFSFSHVLS